MLSQYYSSLDPQALLAKPGVLAVIHFTPECNPAAEPGIVPIGLTSLSGQDCEVITYGDKVARRGISNDCHWSEIDDVLCVATWISPAACSAIESATEAAYNRLFDVIHSAGFPHPFRIWNFIPRINEGEGDREEYKKFCVGRQLAFDKLQLVHRQYPAASALGHHSEGAVIYMLAHKHAGQHHENPRQEPAYRYPRQYGPCSPSFARATSLNLHDCRHIFVSGTASILGHDTKAADDLTQQIAITLANIRHLVDTVDTAAQPLHAIRVYLRHAADFQPARDYLTTHLQHSFNAASVNFLHADVCRDNLLVEIEAASHSAKGCL